MTEAQSTPNPYTVYFEGELFNLVVSDRGRAWTVSEVHFDRIEEATDAYFKRAEVIVYTARPKRDLPLIELYLNDHSMPFDRIQRKPREKHP